MRLRGTPPGGVPSVSYVGSPTGTIVGSAQLPIGKLIQVPGARGPKGDKGDTGDTGPQGDQGIQGIQGVKGDTGDTGPIGATGPDGLSAYEVAVADGFSGTESEWLTSLVGPEGPEGPEGPAGAGSGDMLASVYDPNGVDADAFARANHTGTQAISTVSGLQTALDGKVDENSTITGATKTKITYDAKGLVTSGADATTADISDSTNKRYVTDAQLTVIGNTSGTNTGDQTSVTGNAGTATKLATARNINGVPFDGTADIAIATGASVPPTAVKTSAYSAAVGDLIPADATSGGFTITLPTAPADKSIIVVKKIDSSANTVTIARGGSDVFNVSGGATSLALVLQDQTVALQYKSSGAIWYVTGNSAPVASLDGRYATVSTTQTLTNKTATGLKVDAINDTHGNPLLGFNAWSSSAVNYLQVETSPAFNEYVSVSVQGTDSDITFEVVPKGAGTFRMWQTSGSTATFTVGGGATDIDLNLASKNAGIVRANGNPVGVKVSVPSTATSTGVVGQWAADSGFLYICTASNTWRRVAIASW